MTEADQSERMVRWGALPFGRGDAGPAVPGRGLRVRMLDPRQIVDLRTRFPLR